MEAGDQPASAMEAGTGRQRSSPLLSFWLLTKLSLARGSVLAD